MRFALCASQHNRIASSLGWQGGRGMTEGTMPAAATTTTTEAPPATPLPPPPVANLSGGAGAPGLTVPIVPPNEAFAGGSALSPVEGSRAVLFGKGSIVHGRATGGSRWGVAG